MNILLTNDDGIYADGLWALERRLSPHHRVTVVAPDRERSAISHSITLNEPLRIAEVRFNGATGHTVNGTPADCIKLGMLEILEEKPDVVISGINPGANVGIAIHYSGTVSAAKEAALYGIPAIAVSVNAFRVAHYDTAAGFAASLAERVRGRGLPFGVVLNVNVPDLPPDRIQGVRISRQGIARISEYFEKRVDPRDRPYHWLGSDIQTFDSDMDIDWTALSHHHISVTPIQCDITDHHLLETLRGWGLESPSAE
jgi:5'-nucleotidase